jgi:hypothetical protein
MSYFIHVFHRSANRPETIQQVWNYYLRYRIVTFGYGDNIEKAQRKMERYATDDIIFLYGADVGVVGMARVTSQAAYRTYPAGALPEGAANNHRHIMPVDYLAWCTEVTDAIPVHELRSILGIKDGHLRSLPCPADRPGMHPQQLEQVVRTRWRPVPILPAPISIEEGGETGETHIERILVNRYERDLAKRAACLAHYGMRMCQCCGMVPVAVYGPTATGLLQVHHRTPISSLGSDADVDPVRDLIPVCPNCHYMIHSRVPCWSVEEVQQILEAAASG